MDKNKLIKTGSLIAIVLGCVGLYLGGGTEDYTIEIVGSVFAGIGLIVNMLKK